MNANKFLQFFYLYVLLAIIASILTALALEDRLKARLPAARPYRWGFYVGCIGLACGPLAVVPAIAMVMAVVRHSWSAFGWCLAYMAFFTLHTVCGWNMIRRKRWAWVVGTVFPLFSLNAITWVTNGNYAHFSLNIIAWIINGTYAHNRWGELVGREYNSGEDEARGLLNDATKLEKMGRVQEALTLYAHIAEPYPHTAAAGDAQKSAESLRARFGMDSVIPGQGNSLPLTPPQSTERYACCLPLAKASQVQLSPLSKPETEAAPILTEPNSLSSDAAMRHISTPPGQSPKWKMRKAAVGLSTAFAIIAGLVVLWILLGVRQAPGTQTTVGAAANPKPIWQAKAQKGDAEAQLFLAWDYYRGEGTPKDSAQAAYWFLKAAERGNPDAQRRLGVMYENGEGVPQDAAQATKWYRKALDQYHNAAEGGDAEAQEILAGCYEEGQGVPQDYAEAARWYRKAAEHGRGMAQYQLGCYYQDGQGVPQDYGEAIKWFQKAAERGWGRAQRNLIYCYVSLGTAYFTGQGVPKNNVEAVRWYRKAAEQGDTRAQLSLASMYEFGEGVAKDLAEAFNWYLRAAQQGDAGAQLLLGQCYRDGTGAQKDCKLAAFWYQKAADQGSAYAQYSLGVLYADGEGVPRSSQDAANWYRKAAEQGYADAQSALASYYCNGIGVPKDVGEAAKWWRKAAQQGKVGAQYNLGTCYSRGEGVPQNDIEAYKWFSLAAAQGNERAENARDWAADRMSREEIIEGQRLAAAFVVRRVPPGRSDGLRSALPLLTGKAMKASGTAFFVSTDGYLLSNYHVIKNASTAQVKTRKGLFPATVVRTDPANDLAILKVPGSFPALPIANSADVKQGESAFTVGFPNIELQGIEPKFTRGEISSLSGAQDDPRLFQISVAVQPGNSGGPLVNTFGNVIGIVTARLSDASALELSGALPQNVNYATKSAYALTLLESIPELSGKLKAPNRTKSRRLSDAVQEARDATALVLVY
jgi:TPR repeat protein